MGIHYLWGVMNKAIHHLTVVYLASIILLRMMAMPISLIDYSLNKKFISRYLCENRYRSARSCSGKCFLSKQFARTNDGQSGTDQKGGIKIQLIDFYENLDQPHFGITEPLAGLTPAFRLRPLITRSPDSVFHPPIA